MGTAPTNINATTPDTQGAGSSPDLPAEPPSVAPPKVEGGQTVQIETPRDKKKSDRLGRWGAIIGLIVIGASLGTSTCSVFKQCPIVVRNVFAFVAGRELEPLVETPPVELADNLERAVTQVLAKDFRTAYENLNTYKEALPVRDFPLTRDGVSRHAMQTLSLAMVCDPSKNPEGDCKNGNLDIPFLSAPSSPDGFDVLVSNLVARLKPMHRWHAGAKTGERNAERRKVAWLYAVIWIFRPGGEWGNEYAWALNMAIKWDYEANNPPKDREPEIQWPQPGGNPSNPISIGYPIHYDPGATQLDPGQTAFVDVIADQAKADQASESQIEVVGKAAGGRSDPGDPYSNAKARVEAIKAELMRQGIPSARIDTRWVGARWAQGDDSPADRSAEIRLRLPKTIALTDIQFGLNNPEPKKDLDPGKVQAVADWLEINPDRILVIEGHADASGNFWKNEVLSEKRAEVVADAFREAGVPMRRMRIFGKGSREPLHEEKQPMDVDRRVELSLH